MAPSAWNKFVKQETSKTPHMLPAQLSHLWKNRMSRLVTIHIDYIEFLHNKISNLEKECSDVRTQNVYLKNVLQIICDEPLSETPQ